MELGGGVSAWRAGSRIRGGVAIGVPRSWAGAWQRQRRRGRRASSWGERKKKKQQQMHQSIDAAARYRHCMLAPCRRRWHAVKMLLSDGAAVMGCVPEGRRVGRPKQACWAPIGQGEHREPPKEEARCRRLQKARPVGQWGNGQAQAAEGRDDGEHASASASASGSAGAEKGHPPSLAAWDSLPPALVARSPSSLPRTPRSPHARPSVHRRCKLSAAPPASECVQCVQCVCVWCIQDLAAATNGL